MKDQLKIHQRRRDRKGTPSLYSPDFLARSDCDASGRYDGCRSKDSEGPVVLCAGDSGAHLRRIRVAGLYARIWIIGSGFCGGAGARMACPRTGTGIDRAGTGKSAVPALVLGVLDTTRLFVAPAV